MKLSEVIEAINNDTFEVDATDDMDVVIMVQKVVSDNEMAVRGVLKGDDERMAIMFADRMVKEKEFRDMIYNASGYMLTYLERKSEQAEQERKNVNQA